jgi:phosphohistidine phosphatase SixA
MAAALAAAGWRPARAFASPLRRAQDTARILLAAVAPGLGVETLAELDPDGGPGAVLPALRERNALHSDLLLVGHQPLLGLLASRLIDEVEPRFTPGTLVGIAFDGAPEPGGGRVVETRRPGPA